MIKQLPAYLTTNEVFRNVNNRWIAITYEHGFSTNITSPKDGPAIAPFLVYSTSVGLYGLLHSDFTNTLNGWNQANPNMKLDGKLDSYGNITVFNKLSYMGINIKDFVDYHSFKRNIVLQISVLCKCSEEVSSKFFDYVFTRTANINVVIDPVTRTCPPTAAFLSR